MPYRDLEPVSKQLTIVVGLTVVGFMAFGLALSFYRNVLFEETLGSIQQQNNALRDKISMGFADLEYYRSAQFKDKYAKENLGKLNPGEKVLIITNQPLGHAGTSDTEEATARQQAAYEELLRQMPVIEHWQMYLFRKNEIEKLKKGLLLFLSRFDGNNRAALLQTIELRNTLLLEPDNTVDVRMNRPI